MRFPHWPYLIIALAFAVCALAGTVSALDIPGDLDVGGHTTWSTDTNVNGNITVLSGGWLELTDIDLVMNCTVDGQYTIRVNTGGKLTMDGGSITAGQSMYRYKVILSGAAVLEGVTVTDTWGQGQAFDASTGRSPDLTNMVGGIQIYSNNVYIGNCTLSKGLLTMVYISGCSPFLYGNTISDVIYDVRAYSQVTSDPSTTKWSAVAFGVLLDNAPARLEYNDFTNIGEFDTMTSVYYGGASTNANDYQVIAHAVAARSTRLDVESSTVTDTGVLDVPSDTFMDGCNTVNQRFYRYSVAGIYGYQSFGANIKLNDVFTSNYGLYMIVSTSTTGGKMTFDVIIDNNMSSNAKGGAMFVLNAVSRDCDINVSENDFNDNGEMTTTGLEDCGLAIFAPSGSGDLTVILQQNNFLRNHARGVYIDAQSRTGDLEVLATRSNTFTNNRGAGLMVNAVSIGGDVTLLVENSTLTRNRPDVWNDEGAISLTGSGLTGTLDVKVADTIVTNNMGNGLGIDMGGTLAVNTATDTRYSLHNCNFNVNTEYGVFIMDDYGANAQRSVYDIKNVQANENDDGGVYIHSNSQLGNINFKLDGLTAIDNSPNDVAITIRLAAASFNPKATLNRVRVEYTGGSAAGATGLVLQGVDENKRWELNLRNSYITEPGTSLDAQYCEVDARYCNLTGVGPSVVARDSNIHLRYCTLPDLSAQTMGSGIKIGVFYYQWLNISLVAWQNLEPIANQTVLIKRYRAPQVEVFTGRTDAYGNLTHAMVPFWEKDENNNPLRNDELQAFLTVRGETLNSLWFDFNVSKVGIEDPDVPTLVINTPGDDTVQKSGSLIIQGEIRDVHSGVRAVEVTLDNVVWYQAVQVPPKRGQSRSGFQVEIDDLTDGVYTISIRGWDVARYPIENLSFALVTIKNVKIDTEPPYLQVLDPEDPFSVTNKRLYDIIGHTERSSNIRKLTINDIPLQIIGNTFTFNATLIEGTNTFLIIAEDTAGNIAVVTRQIVLDTQEPTLIISTPRTGFSSRENDFEVSGDTEQTAKVFVKLDDGQPTKVEDRGGTRFYFVQHIKDEGVHTITIIAEDEAGNVNEQQRHVKFDITPPVLEDIVPPFDPKPTNDQRVYVAGRTDTEVTKVKINGFIFDVEKGTFAVEVNMLEGDQVLTIEVEDPAGNYNMTTRNIHVDVTPPMLVDLTVSSTKIGGRVWEMTDDLVINERSVTFRGRLAREDMREMWIQVGSDNRSAIMEEGSKTDFFRDFNLDEGENTISFYATDIAGNKMRVIYILDVDPRSPEMKYFNPKMNNAMEVTVYEDTVTISGKVEDLGIVTLTINSRQVLVTPETGTYQTNVPLVPGLNNIEVVVTDRAGNTATDLLHITYATEADEDETLGQQLKGFWWVFGIIIAIAIVIPLTVIWQRGKFLQEHPELEDYDSKADREGLYDYDQAHYDDEQYREGGGY